MSSFADYHRKFAYFSRKHPDRDQREFSFSRFFFLVCVFGDIRVVPVTSTAFVRGTFFFGFFFYFCHLLLLLYDDVGVTSGLRSQSVTGESCLLVSKATYAEILCTRIDKRT